MLVIHFCVKQYIFTYMHGPIFSGTSVVAENYIGPYSIIDRTDSKYSPTESVLGDQINGTCMPTKQGGVTLQAAFRFPDAAVNGQMSVEVISRSTMDCASPGWTWFVESECSFNHYLECSKETLSTSNAQNLYCEITCECLPTCDYLFIKYNRIPHIKDDSSEMCEIRLMHGDIEPSTKL